MSYVKTLFGGTVTNASSTSATTTAGMTSSSDSIAVVIRWTTSTTTLSSVTDSRGNTYTVDVQKTGSFPTQVAIATCASPTAGLQSGDTVSLTFSATPGGPSAIVAEFGTFGAVDQTGSNGSGTGTTSGSVSAAGATTHATETVIVLASTGNLSGGLTATAPLSLKDSTGDELFLLEDDLTSTGTPTEAFTWVTSRNWAATLATYPLSVSAPTNTVAPTVSGTATVGSTLSTTNGTWTGSPSFTYQWTRDGANISSATSNTYVSQTADVGHAIGCTVTATNAGGSASQASSNTITVTSAGSLSTVVGKTGTSGTAVMQKAKSGWTYIAGKTGTSATAVDQKGAGSFTKIKGH